MQKLKKYQMIIFLSATLLFATAFAIFMTPKAYADRSEKAVIPEHYIVKIQPNGNPAEVANAYGLQRNHTYEHVFNGFAARIPAARLKKLQIDKRVISIVEDRVIETAARKCNRRNPCTPTPAPTAGPTSAPEPTPTSAPSTQSYPTGIRRIQANAVGSYDVAVAVLDSGIDRSHPDLNVVGGINCTGGSRRKYNDDNGHGTHVAGTIGALDNGIGVVGVAPGVPLYAVRVLGSDGSGSWSSIICGIDWVASQANKIKVANMSLSGGGGEGHCNDGGVHEAICNAVDAGVTFIAAAGNSATNAVNTVPATFDEVITVSALADFDGRSGGMSGPTCTNDQDDTMAYFSNYGADVDIIAPGVCIKSTWIGGHYHTISGTSMAAPHVAGMAAVYLAQNPNATPSQVRAALLNGGDYDWSNVDDRDGIKEPMLRWIGP